jgi:hypothetical protein
MTDGSSYYIARLDQGPDRKGKGKGKGRGRPATKREELKAEPIEEKDDPSGILDAELDAIEADAELGVQKEVEDLPEPEMLGIV